MSERIPDDPEYPPRQPSTADADGIPAEGCSASAGPARLSLGQTVELRKPHACGGRVWTVTRTGADVGLECTTCRRRILLTRDEFNRRRAPIQNAG